MTDFFAFLHRLQVCGSGIVPFVGVNLDRVKSSRVDKAAFFEA